MQKRRAVAPPSGSSFYDEHTTPRGQKYWTLHSDPTRGYIVDPSKVIGAIEYPIEYINWLLRPAPPTAGRVRGAATGRTAREIGGQALNGKIGVPYGQVRIGPSVMFGPRKSNASLDTIIVGYGLGQGPCQSLEDIIFPHGRTLAQMSACVPNNTAYSYAWQHHFLDGSLTQLSDSFLRAAVTGSDPATFERYPGLCYVAAQLIASASCWAGLPGAYPLPLFVLKGRKVRNYVTGLDAWTDNPAWITADWITNRRYGRGAQVNVQSVIDAAAYCDETYLNTATGLNEKKHQMDLFVLRAASHESIQDLLRAHFRCNIFEHGGEFIFSIDKDNATAMSFDETEAVPVSIERMGGSGTPNAVAVKGPNPGNNYETATSWARTTALEAGTVTEKSAEYDLEGLTRATHRASEAYYLLNTRLNNLRVVLRAVHPKAMRLQPMDVIEYTSTSFGLTGFKLRVLRVTRSSDGTAWVVECAGHNPAIYDFQSRAIEDYPLPDLPSPFAVPEPPTNFTASVETFAEGRRFTIDWTKSESFAAGDTRITYQHDDGAEVDIGTFPGNGPITFNIGWDDGDYILRAYALNRLDSTIQSNPVELTFTWSTTTIDVAADTVGAGPHTLETIALEDGGTYLLEAFICAHRTGGAGGSANDGAAFVYKQAFERTGGVITEIGYYESHAFKDQDTWDLSLEPSGTDVLVKATGAASNNITWSGTVKITQVIQPAQLIANMPVAAMFEYEGDFQHETRDRDAVSSTASPVIVDRIPISQARTYLVEAHVVGRAANDGAVYRHRAAFKLLNGAVVSISREGEEEHAHEENEAWSFRLVPDQGALALVVIGAAATEIVWHSTTEVWSVSAAPPPLYGGGDVYDEPRESGVTTGYGTATVIDRVNIPNNALVLLETRIVARRVSGAAGEVDDGAAFVRFAAYKLMAGIATEVGAYTETKMTDQEWLVDFIPADNFVEITVTGAEDNDVAWYASTIARSVA